jgi:hypothetical protein
MTPISIPTIEAMENFGGSFVVALAKAIRCADSENVERIKRTWPEIITRYEQMAATQQPNPCHS